MYRTGEVRLHSPWCQVLHQSKARGGTHNNPNVLEFCRNTQALRVVNVYTDLKKGNCHGSKIDEHTDGSI